MAQSKQTWTEVDSYISTHLHKEDPVMDHVLQTNADSGLPAIDVAPNQAKFLHIIALIKGARRILEIGTLGGYSTIWLARALPEDGKLITLEYNPKHAEVARGNIDSAGLASKVEIRTGLANDSLAALHEEGAEPFDLIFIDADKENLPDYLKWSRKLSKPGTVIIGDNVVRNGEVVNASSSDASVQGVRRYFEEMLSEEGVTSTALQTVGSKGYDGFSISVVTS
ncbi:O-methyltransferase [Jeotgalibacillus sp. ET6]|uniref:O-methyltransferase n=1 Tax=Jeotgalibacillus sp. ET6 TaxID=3037260 RepID=UPI002418686A|nr:O-methyltransferase [Jeotgalibacillus sp. ET6]MDG5472312.1 O-methyltransferase [Jeotgalibacillus sp. ET6]